MLDEYPTTLVVDDDHALRERLGRALRERGFPVFLADGCAEALALAERERPSRAIVDLRMPDGNGVDLVRDLLVRVPGMDIVVLTGYGSIAVALEAVRRGAKNVVTKPADADEILHAFDPATALVARPLEAPSLARVEWEHIHRVLADCEGNISEAARRLGVHRRSLQRKLQKQPVQR